MILYYYNIQLHVPALLMHLLLSFAQDPGPAHVAVHHKGIAKSVYDYVILTIITIQTD